MTPRVGLVILGVLLLAASIVGVSAKGGPAPVVQPLAFNHQLHAEQELTCIDCHRQAENGPYATLPTVKTCLLCHDEAKGEHPDEPKIREIAEQGREILWVQVNRGTNHVYFSHAAHVKYAEMSCQECHGKVEEMTEPVTVSQVDHLDMEACMDCHAENDVSNDCLSCHK